MPSVVENLTDLRIGGDNWASEVPSLQKNLGILTPDQIELAKELLHEGQNHLFANWAEHAVEDEKKICFFNQVSRLNANYPGGLAAYIQNARQLLADSKTGRNPFEGFTPSVPSGEVLTFGDDNFIMLEEMGVKEARKAAFVLVAGGLGERLGYNGIKVALPSETTTGTCFLQNYIMCILALQETSCKLTEGRSMVINVEYNQLDPLLRTTGHADGDANCETGYSPFPGNINQLILELGPYIEELNRTHGAIAEFVNPKYKDSSKTSFKASTRLECMMQDYPKTLPPTARVGFTVMDAWLAYAPVKNNPEDAAKVPKGNPYHSATSGEMAIYRANSLILRKAGVQIADPITAVFNGQEVEVWPRIAWKPKWALIFSDVKRKVNKGCSVSQISTMAINGENIYLEGLSLDGTLLITAVSEAEVKVTGSVQNKGWAFKNVDYKDSTFPEEIRIRGFVIEKLEQLEMNYSEPGKFCLQ